MSSLTEAWVNDYLDLYNYARSIGDSEWENSILETLRNMDQLLKEERKKQLLRELLTSYDRINRQLMEVFGKLRAATGASQTESLQEQWYKLKMMRMDVARKILQVK